MGKRVVLNAKCWRTWSSAMLLHVCIWLVASSCNAEDWNAYLHDDQHTSRSSASIDPKQLVLKWNAPAGFSRPLVVGDTVYGVDFRNSGTGVGDIAAFDLATGAIKWRVPTGGGPSALAYRDGRLFCFTAYDKQLNVLNAATGATSYTVPVSTGWFVDVPTLVNRPGGGDPIALLHYNYLLTAVSVGQSTGSVMWTKGDDSGGQATSLSESRFVSAGPGQYRSFDLMTGGVNAFHTSGVSGPSGKGVVVDSARQQFYLHDIWGSAPDSSSDIVSAYSYAGSNGTTSPTLLWQRTVDPGIGHGMALGADGKLYVSSYNTLFELASDTGATLRSVALTDVSQINYPVGPMLSNGYVWVRNNRSITAYSLDTLTAYYTLPLGDDDRPPSWAIGTITDHNLIVDFGATGVNGFAVFAAPEPGSVTGAAAFLLLLACRRPKGRKA